MKADTFAGEAVQRAEDRHNYHGRCFRIPLFTCSLVIITGSLIFVISPLSSKRAVECGARNKVSIEFLWNPAGHCLSYSIHWPVPIFESVVNIHCSVINFSSRKDQWLATCHSQIHQCTLIVLILSATYAWMDTTCCSPLQHIYNHTPYYKDPPWESYFPWIWEFDVMGLLYSCERYVCMQSIAGWAQVCTGRVTHTYTQTTLSPAPPH